MSFIIPPIQHNEEGQERSAGFELEFANINIEESIKIIQELYGGEVQKKHRFHQKVVNTSLGDFTIEIDLKLLNEKTYQKPFDKLNINLQDYAMGDKHLEHEVENALEGLAKNFIPYEIVTPPIKFSQLDEIEKLRLSLYRNDAEDTKGFLTNAFATHINIESPSNGVESILSYLRAFLLLYPWIFKDSEIDFARRVSTFIAPFPSKYAEIVIAPSYKPDLDKLIEDYHIYNPDRNRPLDMYPLFAHIRKEKIDNYHNLGNVKSRPTYHYRLPNSLISSADWSLAKEWNNWARIEKLANDQERLDEMSRDYLDLRKNTLIGFENKWNKKTEKWLS